MSKALKLNRTLISLNITGKRIMQIQVQNECLSDEHNRHKQRMKLVKKVHRFCMIHFT